MSQEEEFEGYVTAQEVMDYLGIDITLSEETDPKKSFVEKFIGYAMAEMETKCKTAWRERTYVHLTKDVPQAWSTNRGVPIYLPHTNIKELDHTQGDKLEVWDGGRYINELPNRDNAIYQDPRRGKIWVRGYLWSWLRDDRLRITYRYCTPMTDDVKEACLKLTCIKLIERSFHVKMLSLGGNINPFEIVSTWKEDLKEFYGNYEEWMVIDN